MSSPCKHKSNNALGAFVISALFALETTELDHATPHAATPYITAALLLAGLSRFLYLKSGRSPRNEANDHCLLAEWLAGRPYGTPSLAGPLGR